MNKRLRKKKHLGEFREFGFYIKVKFNEKPIEADNDYDNFYTFIDIVEAFNLKASGALKGDFFDGIVHVANYRVNIVEQKAKFLAALDCESAIIEVEARENIDVWHDPFDD